MKNEFLLSVLHFLSTFPRITCAVSEGHACGGRELCKRSRGRLCMEMKSGLKCGSFGFVLMCNLKDSYLTA